MPETITAYYDRQPGTVEGFFSIKAYNPKTKKERYIFEKMPARSGNPKHPDTNHIQSTSPIYEGAHFLWLDMPVGNASMFPNTPSGIGRFYQISTSPTNRQISTYGSKKREDLGLHPENAIRGSAGCIVLLHDDLVQEATVIALFAFLDALGKTQQKIKLIVC